MSCCSLIRWPAPGLAKRERKAQRRRFLPSTRTQGFPRYGRELGADDAWPLLGRLVGFQGYEYTFQSELI